MRVCHCALPAMYGTEVCANCFLGRQQLPESLEEQLRRLREQQLDTSTKGQKQYIPEEQLRMRSPRDVSDDVLSRLAKIERDVVTILCLLEAVTPGLFRAGRCDFGLSESLEQEDKKDPPGSLKQEDKKDPLAGR